MAGSFKHVDGGISMIENGGDAAEAIEELYYLVRCFADDAEIAEALEKFYAYERGEADPHELSGGPEFGAMPSLSDFGTAYLKTKAVMEL